MSKKSIWRKTRTPKKDWPQWCEVCRAFPPIIEINRVVSGKRYHKFVCFADSKARIDLLLELIEEERLRKPWVPI